MMTAELHWVLRGRTFVTLLFVAVALNVLAAYGTITGLPTPQHGSTDLMATTSMHIVALGFGGNLFSMIYGAMTVTNDFRSSAIVRRSFLSGGPERLLGFRTIVLIVPAAIFAVASAAAVLLTAVIALPLNEYRFAGSQDLVVTLCGVVFTVFAMTFLGQFVGWLVRNTLVCVLGLVVWSLLVETAVVAMVPHVGRYLPGGATQAITLDTSATTLILPVGAGYAVLTGWVLVLGFSAVVRIRRSDLA